MKTRREGEGHAYGGFLRSTPVQLGITLFVLFLTDFLLYVLHPDRRMVTEDVLLLSLMISPIPPLLLNLYLYHPGRTPLRLLPGEVRSCPACGKDLEAMTTVERCSCGQPWPGLEGARQTRTRRVWIPFFIAGVIASFWMGFPLYGAIYGVFGALILVFRPMTRWRYSRGKGKE